MFMSLNHLEFFCNHNFVNFNFEGFLLTQMCFSRGTLMDEAMILTCGHSFGSVGLQHVLRMVGCFICLPSCLDASLLGFFFICRPSVFNVIVPFRLKTTKETVNTFLCQLLKLLRTLLDVGECSYASGEGKMHMNIPPRCGWIYVFFEL